jgi:hypothetical protein
VISRRRLTLTGVAVALTVLGGVIAWVLVRPANPDAGVRLVNGRMIGEATGYVAGVDPDERLLQVSSSFLRLRPLKLSVGDDAKIRIRDKEGGLGDLALDMPVHVTYEMDGATRRVRTVELLSTPRPSNSNSAAPETPRAPTTGSPAKPTAPTVAKPPAGALPSPAVPRVSEPPRASESPRVTERPRASEPASIKDPFRVPEPPRPSDAPRSTEAPRKDATAVAPRRPAPPAPADESHRERAAPPRPSVDEKSSVAAGVSSAPRSNAQRTADDGAADGSAAIDWLLKNRGSDGR